MLTRTRTAQTRQQHVSPSRPLEGSTFSGERAASLPGPLASLTPRSQPPGPKLRFPSNHSNNVVPSAPSFWDFSWRSLPCSSFVLPALPGGLWLRCSPPGAPSQTPHAPGVALQQGTRLLPRAVPRVNPSLCALPSCGQCKIPVLHMHKQNPPSNCLHSRASTFHVKPDGSPPPAPNPAWLSGM